MESGLCGAYDMLAACDLFDLLMHWTLGRKWVWMRQVKL